MAPPSLLGPPELRYPSTTTTTTATGPTDHKAMNSPCMGLTENMSATYLSTGNPCLDFFFHIVPDSRSDSIKEMLQLSWAHDPLRTLKLICNLRGVRGTGKSDKEGFYTAALWLHEHHPKTLACNLDSIVNFGYFKDLPEILYRILEGPNVRMHQQVEWSVRKLRALKWKRPRPRGLCSEPQTKSGKERKKHRSNDPKDVEMPDARKKHGSNNEPKDVEMPDAIERSKMEKKKEKARALMKEKKIAKAKKVIDRYSHDPEFRFLHERVSDVFAACLKADMEFVESNEPWKIGLASKWCPSVDSSLDRSTLLCESIAKKVFPRENYPEYQGVEEQHYAYRVRDRLRKQVLVPLHKLLELPEVHIGSILYNRVASVAMMLHKEKFLKHDNERFTKYLEDVKAGKSTIAADVLLPHEIIASLRDEGGEEVADLQWKRMVSDLLQKGKLRNCMAVCGSMLPGMPVETPVALAVLVSDLSEEPWKGKLITFGPIPKLQLVEGETLKARTKLLRAMRWGIGTDFQKVFDLILGVAVDSKLKPEQMIKRLFVFSDMEFDKASTNKWETDYHVIVKKFTEKGYGEAIPQMVFWNLRHSQATPVLATQKGVALVSGFSKNLLKMFLDQDGQIDPQAVMEAAISGEDYQKLVVLD